MNLIAPLRPIVARKHDSSAPFHDDATDEYLDGGEQITLKFEGVAEER